MSPEERTLYGQPLEARSRGKRGGKRGGKSHREGRLRAFERSVPNLQDYLPLAAVCEHGEQQVESCLDALAACAQGAGLMQGEGCSEASLIPPSVATSAVSLESTLHSRERRGQRQLTARELQAAVKHAAHTRMPGSGSQGRPTWKIVYGDLTVVTDETMKVAITAWRNGRQLAPESAPAEDQALGSMIM